VALLEQRLGDAGEVVATSAGPAVACSPGALLLLEVQPPGKRPMTGRDFARGARAFLGTRLR
jgi:methionyl-tRNA formyltransferase